MVAPRADPAAAVSFVPGRAITAASGPVCPPTREWSLLRVGWQDNLDGVQGATVARFVRPAVVRPTRPRYRSTPQESPGMGGRRHRDCGDQLPTGGAHRQPTPDNDLQ